MVNNISASASEILAAALQDYGRAVIVGSTTYGKGTVQRFYDLDRAYKGASAYKPLGNIKMTMQKFYRIDGGSTQLSGVTPDIELPDNFKYIDYGERQYDNALPFSEIEPRTYSQDVVKLTHLQDIKAKSESRIKANPDFQLIDENARRLKANENLSQFSLKLDTYVAEMDALEQESKKYEHLMKDGIANFSVGNLDVDYENITLDESIKAKNDDWIKDVSKDLYLTETMSIMRDMIEMEDSFASIEERIQVQKKEINRP
jgi:carboxyl-terminal processing protease